MAAKRNPISPYWIAIEKREREIIEGALTSTGGNVSRAAQALFLKRTHFIAIMNRLDIRRDSFLAAKVQS